MTHDFALRGLRFRLLTDYKRQWRGRRSLAVKLLIGKREAGHIGAGYIGGRTLFVAYNSGSRAWSRDHRNDHDFRGKRFPLFTRLTLVEAGLTRNANLVPYVSH